MYFPATMGPAEVFLGTGRTMTTVSIDQKNILFQETQRFILVTWVKLLNIQPWGPRWSHGRKNFGQNPVIFGPI